MHKYEMFTAEHSCMDSLDGLLCNDKHYTRTNVMAFMDYCAIVEVDDMCKYEY